MKDDLIGYIWWGKHLFKREKFSPSETSHPTWQQQPQQHRVVDLKVVKLLMVGDCNSAYQMNESRYR